MKNMDQSKRRVLFLINNLGSGGAQRQLSYLAPALRDRGYIVQVGVFSCKHEKERFFFGDLFSRGIPLHNLTTPMKLWSFIKIMNLVKKFRPDIVYTFLETANLWGTLSARLVGGRHIHIINSLRGIGPSDFKYISIWKRLCSAIISNSQTGAKILSDRYGVAVDHIHYIPNGFPEEFITDGFIKERNGDDVELPIIVHVARISRTKNQQEALEGWMKSGVDRCMQLWFVGAINDQSYYKQLVEFIETNKLNNVHFLGSLQDVSTIYSKASLGLLTSVSEGYPNVVVEYLANGLPVIASNVGDVRYILEKCPKPLLYTSGDADELSDLLRMFVACSAEDQKKYGVSRNALLEFSITALCDRTEIVFEKFDTEVRI